MYYDFYTEDKIIVFITKTQLFTNYAFSHAISAEKLKMQISNYNSRNKFKSMEWKCIN